VALTEVRRLATKAGHPYALSKAARAQSFIEYAPSTRTTAWWSTSAPEHHR
jgi:hypothetical protein